MDHCVRSSLRRRALANPCRSRLTGHQRWCRCAVAPQAALRSRVAWPEKTDRPQAPALAPYVPPSLLVYHGGHDCTRTSFEVGSEPLRDRLSEMQIAIFKEPGWLVVGFFVSAHAFIGHIAPAALHTV